MFLHKEEHLGEKQNQITFKMEIDQGSKDRSRLREIHYLCISKY